MDVTLPDGTVIKDVPEGTTKAQLAQKLQANGYDIGKLRPVQAPQQAPKEPGALEKAAPYYLGPAGTARGVVDLLGLLDKAAYEGGGLATDAATKIGASPEVAAGAGTAANVGIGFLPSLLGGGVAKAAGSPLMQDAARWFMRSALKPSTVPSKAAQGERAVTTLLEEGINVSKGGVEKLKGRIDDLEEGIESALKGSTATVDKQAAASRIQDLIAKIDQTNPTPQKARAAAEAVYNDFVTNVLAPNKIPVERANDMKRAIYKEVRESYGKEAGATIEAQKALGRGLKEEVGAAIPGIGQKMAEQGELLNALNAVERRALQQMNNNPGGLALLTKNPEMFVAFMADKSALFKSIVARMLNAGSNVIPETAGRIVGGTIGAASGLAPE